MSIHAWSLLATKHSNRSDRNKLRDTCERRRTPLTGGMGVLITQRSKVQILPPQPILSITYEFPGALPNPRYPTLAVVCSSMGGTSSEIFRSEGSFQII